MGIVFLKTRHDYQSYWDFWRLVDLSGFPVRYVDQINLESDDTYVLTPWNGEVETCISGERNCRIVWWNLERPDGPHASLESRIAMAEPHVDAIWVSDRWYASLDSRLRFVLVGGHPDFGSITKTSEQWDYAHLSYAWGRRESMYQQLRTAGLREAPEAWTVEQKNRVVGNAKLVLSMHQYEAPIIAPMRFAVAAAYGKPVVTEKVADSFPCTDGVDIVEASYNSIVDVVVRLSRDHERRNELGRALRRLFCERMTFAKCVSEGVEAL